MGTKPAWNAPWSALDLELLRILYNEANNRILATVLKKSMRGVERQANILRLKKSAACIRSRCAPRSKFKPGHAGARTQRLGATSKRKDGRIFTKIASAPGAFRTNWRRSHFVAWETDHGPIPNGHTLAFRDGNRRNVAMDNLELITLSERLRRHCFLTTPPSFGPRCRHCGP